jgi:hypothetical protein
MRDQLISSETAQLAKEKGYFDSDVNQCWVICENKYYNNKNMLRSDIPYLVDGCDTILQPTQSLLQKWLREKHRVHIYVQPTIDFNKWTLDNNFYQTYDSYEIALEQGLQQALKLLP